MIGSNKLQAVELMKREYFLNNGPEAEAGQDNALDIQLVRDSQTALINFTNDDLIDRAKIEVHSDGATAHMIQVSPLEKKFTYIDNGDEKGKLIAERTIHMGIQGTGNAAVKTVQGRIEYHIVELTAEEIIAQLALDDDV